MRQRINGASGKAWASASCDLLPVQQACIVGLHAIMHTISPGFSWISLHEVLQSWRRRRMHMTLERRVVGRYLLNMVHCLCSNHSAMAAEECDCCSQRERHPWHDGGIVKGALHLAGVQVGESPPRHCHASKSFPHALPAASHYGALQERLRR